MPIEIIDKLKQKNNGNFKLIDATDIEMSNGKDAESFISELNNTITTVNSDLETISANFEEHIANHPAGKGGGVHTGNKPPEDKDLLWIDTSSNTVNEIFTSAILDEIRRAFQAVINRINTLEEEVEFIKQNCGGPGSGGGSGGGNNGEETPNSNALITEDGNVIVTESGDTIILESGSDTLADNDMLRI